MKRFWDISSRLYDFSQLVTNKRANAKMARLTGNEVPKGALVLDCAAGTGILSMAASKKARHVVCSDMSKEMLIEAMKKSRRLGIHNISFAKRDITALCDPDNKYDVVIAGNVMHLLDEPQKAFSELVRVTKPGGKIIIPTYLQAEAGIFGCIAIKLYRLLGAHFGKSFSMREYLGFIAGNTDENGCSDCMARYIGGNIPVGLAIIRK